MYNDQKVISIIPIPNYLLTQNKELQAQVLLDGKFWHRTAIALLASGEMAYVYVNGDDFKVFSKSELARMEFAAWFGHKYGESFTDGEQVDELSTNPEEEHSRKEI